MEVSIESIQKKFTNHLQLPENNRILFSAKFGTGKSYFLKKYFETNSDYNLFWINPVNYVVGANHDIFEWIKIDLAKILLTEKSISNETEDFPENLLIQTFLYNKSSSIFGTLLERVANEIAKFKTGIDFLEKLDDDIKEYKEQYNRFKDAINEQSKSNEQKVTEFLDNAIEIGGSIFEDDIITRILRASLEILKKKSSKKNVLVIDDLDRLDPDHIFRILNILSAHNDHFDTNKFGFDKVIIVCDYENIKNIYQYKYGIDVDFSGYIEKFYTYEPYFHTITDAIVKYCSTSIALNSLDNDSLKTLTYLLVVFYQYDKLNIRSLKKIVLGDEIINHINLPKIQIQNSESDLNNAKFTSLFKTKHLEIDLNNYGILKVIFILLKIFGSIDNLKKSMDFINNKINPSIDNKYLHNTINTLAIVYNFVINKQHPDRIFFNWDEKGYNNERITYPKLRLLDRQYEIHFGWSASNPYIGGDFFEHSRLIPIDSSGGDSRLRSLFQTIEYILGYIEKEKLFDHLG